MIENPILYVTLEDDADTFRTEVNGADEKKDATLKRGTDVKGDDDVKKSKVLDPAHDAVSGGSNEQEETCSAETCNSERAAPSSESCGEVGDNTTTDEQLQSASSCTENTDNKSELPVDELKTEQDGDVTNITQPQSDNSTKRDDVINTENSERPNDDVVVRALEPSGCEAQETSANADGQQKPLTSSSSNDVRGKDWWGENYWPKISRTTSTITTVSSPKASIERYSIMGETSTCEKKWRLCKKKIT